MPMPTAMATTLVQYMIKVSGSEQEKSKTKEYKNTKEQSSITGKYIMICWLNQRVFTSKR